MTLEELETLISDTLDIPALSENNAVMDGSFNTEPWMSSALIGDGIPVHITDFLTINLFYVSKDDAIDAIHELWPVLSANNVAVSSPDYTYQDNANIWMVSVNIQK